jgi:hypothetical protein
MSTVLGDRVKKRLLELEMIMKGSSLDGGDASNLEIFITWR